MTTYDLAKGGFYAGGFEPTAFADYTPVIGLVAGQGALSLSVSVSLAGLAMTAAQGALAKTAAKPLTGQACTSGQGTVALTAAKPITGQACTVGQGTIVKTVAKSILGQAMALGQGNIGKIVAKLLLGQAANVGQGVLSLVNTLALIGQQMVTRIGKLHAHYDPGAEHPVPVPSEYGFIVISAETCNAYVPPEENVLYIPVEAVAGDAEKY